MSVNIGKMSMDDMPEDVRNQLSLVMFKKPYDQVTKEDVDKLTEEMEKKWSDPEYVAQRAEESEKQQTYVIYYRPVTTFWWSPVPDVWMQKLGHWANVQDDLKKAQDRARHLQDLDPAREFCVFECRKVPS